MKTCTIALLVFLLITPGFASEERKLELIKEFLAVSDSRGTLEKLRIDNVAQTRGLLFRQAGEKAKNPIMKRLLDRAMEKYADYSKEIFAWPKWEARYVALYDELFSEADIEGIVAFLKTDAGKAMIRAQPEIGKRMQQQMFAKSSEANARIDIIMKDTVAEIQEEIAKEGANQAPEPTPSAVH